MEYIFPVDFRYVGHISDAELHQSIVQQLPHGVRLTALFDSYHSTDARFFPYICSTQGILRQPVGAEEAGQKLLGIVLSAAQGGQHHCGHCYSVPFNTATSAIFARGLTSYAKELQRKPQQSYIRFLNSLRDEMAATWRAKGCPCNELLIDCSHDTLLGV